MSLANRFQYWTGTGAWVVLILSLALCAILVYALRSLPCIALSAAPSEPQPRAWPAPGPAHSPDWSVFETRTGGAPSEGGSLAKRFRLAGTFFAYGETIQDQRKAILDDLRTAAQHILSENEEIDGVRVVRIFRNRVILREGATEEQLWLSFSGDTDGVGEAPGIAETTPLGTGAAGEAAVRYGLKRVGERRWLFKRERLLQYYQELRDEPERLVNLFDSMKPLYDEQSKITGYQLGVEGESEFFGAVGLREGDTVRSVNSIPMTNRRRAEYFVTEFVNNRANAFVLEVERDGQTSKLIYQVR